MAYLDSCASAPGRRRLAGWLSRPLRRVRDIVARQDAIHDLMTVAVEAAGTARKAFASAHL